MDISNLTEVADSTDWIIENARVWAHLGYRLHDWMDWVEGLLLFAAIGAVTYPVLLWLWNEKIRKKNSQVS